MGRKRNRPDHQAVLDLTPMIDVVFQLLIFFLVTMKPMESIGHLDVFRPAPDPKARPEQKLDNMIRITVQATGDYLLNQRIMNLAALENNLQKASARSKTQTILIQCAEASRHEHLVRVLDLCAKVGLTNISVATLPTAKKVD